MTDLVRYPEQMLDEIMLLAGSQDTFLSPEDRIGVVNECFILAAAGYYPPSVPFGLALSMKDEREAWVMNAIRLRLADQLDHWKKNKRITVELKALMRKIFVPIAKTMTFDARPNEVATAPVARAAAILGAMLGEDPK